jgi:O-antigen/teichoic acid export membrane protein
MSEKRSLRSGLSFGALSFAVSALVAIVSSIVTARIYGVDVIGQFALVSAPAGAIWFLSNAGEQIASVRLLVDLPRRDPKVTGIFAAVFTFSMTLTTVVGLLVLAAAYFLLRGPVGQPELFAPAAVNTAGCVLISNPAWNLETPLTAFMAGRELFWIRLLQPLMLMLISIGLAIMSVSVWDLVIATVASWAISLVHRLIVIRPFVSLRYLLRPRSQEIREGFSHLPEVLGFGLRLVPGMMSGGIAYEVGVWVLGVKSSVSAVGAYNRAWTVIRRFTEVNWRVAEMLFPALTSRHNSGDLEGFSRAAVDTMRYVLIIVLLPAAVGGGGAESVMRVFGPEFAPASGVLAILLLVPGLALLEIVQETVLLARDRPTAVSAISIAQMLTTLVATIVFTDWKGIDGPAIGLICGFAVSLIGQAALTRGTFSAPMRTLFPISHAIAAVLAYGAGFAVARLCVHLIHPLIPQILAVGVFGTLAYAATILVFVRPLPRDRERLWAVLESTRLRFQSAEAKAA